MEITDKDKVVDEVLNDKSSDKQSEETKEEPPTLEKVAELAKGLQKGYTLTRQEMSEMKGNLQQIADAINAQSGADKGTDRFLTENRLREILSEQSNVQEQIKSQADAYIEDTLASLRAEGKLANENEENELLNYALKIKEPDLKKAAEIYSDIKAAKNEALKGVEKSKAKQEEGSKIGTSSKASTGEQGGVDYQKVKRMDWSQF